jgi:hypothetical protein
MTAQAWTEDELRAALDAYEEELRGAGKARNTVATYVQHPERFINWLVGRYRPQPAERSAGPGKGAVGRRSKYQPLRAHLAGRKEPVVRMTFVEIEAILGADLPASARRYRPWWANEAAGTHVHARAWLDVGRRAINVDLGAELVEFVL